jgi:hypothetical protein
MVPSSEAPSLLRKTVSFDSLKSKIYELYIFSLLEGIIVNKNKSRIMSAFKIFLTVYSIYVYVYGI